MKSETATRYEIRVGESRANTDGSGGFDVDFELELDGKAEHGSVTLLPHEDGRPGYGAWGGSMDCWLDGRTVARVRELDDDTQREILDAIEGECADGLVAPRFPGDALVRRT